MDNITLNNANVWINCSGSAIPNGKVLKKSEKYEHYKEMRKLAFKVLLAENGVGIEEFKTYLTEEQKENVETFTNAIINLTYVNDNFGIRVEKEAFYATTDIKIVIDFFSFNDRVLEIHKYKPGFRFVNSTDHFDFYIQLFSMYEPFDILYSVDEIRFITHQPAINSTPYKHVINVKESRQKTYEEFAHIFDTIESKYNAAVHAFNNPKSEKLMSDNYHSGEHCIYCDNIATCKYVAEDLTKEIFNSETGEIKKVDSDVLDYARLLELEPIITGFYKQIKAYLTSELREGKEYSGICLTEKSYGSRKWSNEDKVVKLLRRKRIHLEKMYNTKLKSVKQIEALFKNQKKSWGHFREYIITPQPSVEVALTKDVIDKKNIILNDFEDFTKE